MKLYKLEQIVKYHNNQYLLELIVKFSFPSDFIFRVNKFSRTKQSNIFTYIHRHVYVCTNVKIMISQILIDVKLQQIDAALSRIL